MAKVAKGQFESEGLYADEFLRYAATLASLSREEVIFLATLHRHFIGQSTGSVEIYRKVVDELVGRVFTSKNDVQACLTALQRTGLVLPIVTPVLGGAGYTSAPSPLLERVISLASFEDALKREPK